MLNLSTQDIRNNRVLAMMFLADDLCLHKQYYGKIDKATIKSTLQKYLSFSEVQAVAYMYNKEWPTTETFDSIPSIVRILEDVRN